MRQAAAGEARAAKATTVEELTAKTTIAVELPANHKTSSRVATAEANTGGPAAEEEVEISSSSARKAAAEQWT
ncbi:hypothetical protein PoB_003936800 [Plakobranchus ocellatus]|uniref:Uncharacterized protein n=1 Tax=Plakobranchus ocellatus TaxID=259542 RepID=A0AAV4AZY2_9GAST|nr:hypothetical protein PoB_003936800 [Plakobranchus ocellatus]